MNNINVKEILESYVSDMENLVDEESREKTKTFRCGEIKLILNYITNMEKAYLHAIQDVARLNLTKMITIKTINDNRAEINIPKGTPKITMLLGIEMLIEALLDTTDNNIDDLLSDLKRIYERDNTESEENE